MPTSHPRHSITETPELAAVLRPLREQLGDDMPSLGELVRQGAKAQLRELQARDRARKSGLSTFVDRLCAGARPGRDRADPAIRPTVSGLVLLDVSAFWRLGSPALADARRDAVADRLARGLVAGSTPLLLETRAGSRPPAADPGELPLLWITERAERRAAALQLQLRAAHQHLGVPPMDYLIAAIAEDHGAGLLHYDADFQRRATYSDLAVQLEALAPLGSLP